jgi:hypothetical protein
MSHATTEDRILNRARYYSVGIATALALVVAILSGCGGQSYPIAPVSGVVTLDGQPLAGARIGFEPRRSGESINAGPGSYAVTDAQGHFRLLTLYGRNGAVIGEHEVWIRTFQAPATRGDEIMTAIDEKVPARYNDQTTLTFTVPPEGTEGANFELTTKP